jgi:S1-C subfamily serine protease
VGDGAGDSVKRFWILDFGFWISQFAAAAAISSTTPALADDSTPLRAVREAEARRVESFARSAKSVVCIFASPERGGGGSGVIIDPDGYGLSNFHVVQEFIGSRDGYGGLNDGKLYPLHVLGIDPGGDIVLFKLEGRDSFDFAPLGDTDVLRVGEYVAAMGNPFLVAEDFTPTITLGIISGLHRYQEGQGNLLEYADCIQVSTSINPGNSGGPLFDMQGRVLGINGRASFEERGRVNVGLGYAVTANQIKRFLPGLRSGRLMVHGTLGATVQQLGDDVVLNAIQDLSPAEKAGLSLGDKILAINGRRVRTPNDYNNYIAILPADWPVRVKYSRDGKEREATARLERLSLRTSMTYVPDLERNHAEITRLLTAMTRAARVPAGTAAVVFGASLRGPEESAAAQQSRVRVGLTGSGEARIADAVGVSFADASIWAEYRTFTGPLIGPTKLGIDWELVGGDEIEGRTAYVIERRDGDRTVRWSVDLERLALLQVEIVGKDGKDWSIWKPGAWQEFGPLRWPARWERRDSRNQTTVVEISGMEIGGAESAPATQPGGP